MNLIFFVNGKKVVESTPDPEQTLLEYLRGTLKLTGSKLACGEGGCGACTVMVSKYDRQKKTIKHFTVNACLAPVCSMHGLAVTTVEGIGSTQTKLHPAQERIAKAHGTQCGFCTPGFVMSMYTLLRNTSQPDLAQLLENFQGNLCRCTGYRSIIEGYRTFTKEFQTSGKTPCGLGEKCCRNQPAELFTASEFTPYNPDQEPIFPPELQLNDSFDKQTLLFTNSRNVTWYRPTTLNELLKFKHDQPEAKIINGNTEVGVEVKFKKLHYQYFVCPSQIQELTDIEVLENGVKVGAAVTHSQLEDVLKFEISKCSESESRLYQAIVEMLHYFGGKQVRNVASIGGNIMTASPISDLNPIFLAAGVTLEVESFQKGSRTFQMTPSFFSKGYRTTTLESTEILKSIFIPKTLPEQHFVAIKQSKRKEDDISTVVMALNVLFEEGTRKVSSISIVFGGVAPITYSAVETSKMLQGMDWNEGLVELATSSLQKECTIPHDAPGGMVDYRQSLISSLFYKAFLKIQQELLNINVLPDDYSKFSNSTQTFEIYGSRGETVEAIRKPTVHVSALKHATGEAMFCDDIPKVENELHVGLVLSTKAHAKIISIDESEALAVPGVVAFFSGKDIPSERNSYGFVIQDDQFFRTDVVTAQGQIVGFVVADTQKTAKRAAGLVKVTYEDLPTIITIEQALTQSSFHPGHPKTFVSGDVDADFLNADQIIEGDLRMGGQEHFYMETHTAIAYPRDSDDLEIYCSTQSLSGVQHLVAIALGIPLNRIICKTKRVGGGFGGKEERSLMSAIPAAFAAYHLKRPVRAQFDRDEDMMSTGNRHPFYFKYKLAVTNEGLIRAADLEIYSNGGCTVDVSFAVMDNCLMNITGAYMIPHVRAKYGVLKTNLPTNVAFRGFGAPQAMLCVESIIRKVASTLGRDCLEIQRLNMYKNGDRTFNTIILDNCNVRRCFEEVIQRSDFERRKQEVQKFNATKRWRKQGITISSCKNGVALLPEFMRQAGALVHIYIDGSVGLFHGGIEIGQGLHTKLIQIASTVLNIPIERIYTFENSTDKVPNAVPTCASMSSDTYGMAVLHACNELLKRLQPIREKFPDNDWNFWVHEAYMRAIQLSATGFHKILDLDYDIDKNMGNPFVYFSDGAAVTHVEIDCLTGSSQVLRTDIVMDVGASLNPAIDIGQIEGAFIQGLGLFTMEELIYSPNGTLYSKGPGAYKIPAISDIPGIFNVALLSGTENPKAIYSSKAIGEPPLTLATSVFFAIKEAITAARQEVGLTDDFKLDSPATPERIRLACHNRFSVIRKPTTPAKGMTSSQPWNVQP